MSTFKVVKLIGNPVQLVFTGGINPTGEYDNGTAYATGDSVSYATTGSSYVAIQATTGNLPTNPTYWQLLAEGVTDEEVQDNIGSILVDTASVDLSYNDGTPSITATVLPAGVDHNSLANFVANKHIDHSAVVLTAGSGLTGGGDITISRSFAVDINGQTGITPAGADELLIADASSAFAIRKVSISDLSTLISATLTTEVIQDAIGAALTDTATIDFTYDDAGNTITADLKNTTVTAASYGSATQVATFTVDAQGRLTAAANATIAITSGAVTDFNEAAQDAVGGILVDTNSINFSYNDGTPSITAEAILSGVDASDYPAQSVLYSDGTFVSSDTTFVFNDSTETLSVPIINGGSGASGNLVLRSTTNASKGQVYVDETTAASSTTTGALRVGGGVGIAGAAHLGSVVSTGTGTWSGLHTWSANGIVLNDNLTLAFGTASNATIKWTSATSLLDLSKPLTTAAALNGSEIFGSGNTTLEFDVIFGTGNLAAGGIGNAYIFGEGNSTAATTTGPIIFGSGNSSDGDGSISIGIGNTITAAGTNGIAIGSGVTISNTGIAIGTSSSASGSFSFCMGVLTSATGTNAVALANLAQATANNAIAIGNSASASAANAIAIGNGATCAHTNAMAIKGSTTATNQYVIGGGTGGIFNDLWLGGITTTGAQTTKTINVINRTGTNVAGNELRINPGLGTGTGLPGDLVLFTGVVQASGTTAHTLAERVRVNTAELIINDTGLDYDMRVEGDTDTSLLHCDASADTVQVGSATTADSAKFYVNGKGSFAGEVEINGDLNHDGSNIGFFGTAPAAQSTGWSVTNSTSDKVFDADATTIDELADVLGTLINQLKTHGLLGA